MNERINIIRDSTPEYNLSQDIIKKIMTKVQNIDTKNIGYRRVVSGGSDMLKRSNFLEILRKKVDPTTVTHALENEQLLFAKERLRIIFQCGCGLRDDLNN